MLIWFGIGLNILASLINIYEKLNNNILKKLLIDIDKIKKGVYSVESQLIDIENNDGNLPTTSSTLNSTTLNSSTLNSTTLLNSSTLNLTS